jgi:hypothetical protein
MKSITLLLVSILFVLGCSTGKKALEQGNYDQAVNQAVSRLQSNGDSKKAKSTLKQAYNYALGLHMDNISRYSELLLNTRRSTRYMIRSKDVRRVCASYPHRCWQPQNLLMP